MAKFLVTGGAGFIGGNFLHIVVNKYPNDQYVCIDALTYAGNMETLAPIMDKPNFKFPVNNQTPPAIAREPPSCSPMPFRNVSLFFISLIPI